MKTSKQVKPTETKHAVLTEKRKTAFRALYEFCAKHGFTIEGTANFHDLEKEDGDSGGEIEFNISIGTAGVEIECLPEKRPPNTNPHHHFLYDMYPKKKDDGKWKEGAIQPTLVCGH